MIGRLVESLRQAFGRLTERQQFTVVSAGAGTLLFALLLFGLLIASGIHAAERRVKIKSGQFTEVLDQQSIYRARQQQRDEQMRALGRTRMRLVSVVEQVARQAGVDIGQLRPDDSEPTADGVVESRVDLRASGLSADRLQKFLSLLENSPGVVVVRRLKVTRPYRKDVVDVELTVTTYRLKGS